MYKKLIKQDLVKQKIAAQQQLAGASIPVPQRAPSWETRCLSVQQVLDGNFAPILNQTTDLLQLVRGTLRVEEQCILKKTYHHPTFFTLRTPVLTEDFGANQNPIARIFLGAPTMPPLPATQAAINLFTPININRLCTQSAEPMLDIFLFHGKSFLETIPTDLNVRKLQILALVIVLYYCYVALSKLVMEDSDLDDDGFTAIAFNPQFANLNKMISKLVGWMDGPRSLPLTFTEVKQQLLALQPGPGIPTALLNFMEAEFEKSPFLPKPVNDQNFENRLVADLLAGASCPAQLNVRVTNETSWVLRLPTNDERREYIKLLTLFLKRQPSFADLQNYAQVLLPKAALEDRSRYGHALAHMKTATQELSMKTMKTGMQMHLNIKDETLATEIANVVLATFKQQAKPIEKARMQSEMRRLRSVSAVCTWPSHGLTNSSSDIKEILELLDLPNVSRFQVWEKLKQLQNGLLDSIHYFEIRDPSDAHLSNVYKISQEAVVKYRDLNAELQQLMENYQISRAALTYGDVLANPRDFEYLKLPDLLTGQVDKPFALHRWFYGKEYPDPAPVRALPPMPTPPLTPRGSPSAPAMLDIAGVQPTFRMLPPAERPPMIGPIDDRFGHNLDDVKTQALLDLTAWFDGWQKRRDAHGRIDLIGSFITRIKQFKYSKNEIEEVFKKIIILCHKAKRATILGKDFGQTTATQKLNNTYEKLFGYKVDLSKIDLSKIGFLD